MVAEALTLRMGVGGRASPNQNLIKYENAGNYVIVVVGKIKRLRTFSILILMLNLLSLELVFENLCYIFSSPLSYQLHYQLHQ